MATKKTPVRPNVDTGGGSYVGGNVNTEGGDFVGGDKIDNNRSVNIGGNASNVQIVTGDGNTVSQESYQEGVTTESFLALLDQLKEQSQAAGLTAADAAKLDFIKALAELEKPDVKEITEQLTKVKTSLETVGKVKDAGKKAIDLVSKSIAWAKKLWGA